MLFARMKLMNPKKAENIRKHNLGRKKLNRKRKTHKARLRDIAFKAAHGLVDKAQNIVTEDLTKPIRSSVGKKYGKNHRRRLNVWVKGILAEALNSVSHRRGASVIPVNCAYTSQIHYRCGCFGIRQGDRFYCPVCREEDSADGNAAKNVLARLNDSEISLWTPYKTVKSILQTRICQTAGIAQPGL